MTVRLFTEPQQGASYQQLLDLALVAEESGFDAFFRSDHVLKMGDVSGLPGVTDAWTTLAGLARDTTTIRLGTLVTPVTFRAPGMLAVTAAQVDQMSGGRVEVGVGAGWYDAEHTAFGIAFLTVRERMDLLEDQLAILHGAWRTGPGETFDYEGRSLSVSIPADTIRPAQSPHPPIVMGGSGAPRSSRLAAAYADEFNVPFASVEDTRQSIDNVRAAVDAAGRDQGSMIYSTAQVLCCGKDDAEVERRAAATGREVDELRANGLAGSPAEIVDRIGGFTDLDIARVYLQVLDIDDHDHIRLVAEEVLPHVAGS